LTLSVLANNNESSLFYMFVVTVNFVVGRLAFSLMPFCLFLFYLETW